jgi:4'-phosphopantetheinyl transferase EntD
VAGVEPLAAALAALAPPGVRTGCRLVDAGDESGLFPDEAAAVARAVPARRAEFASGRALLRQLLGADEAIAVGDGRRPLLPAGGVGSLAHAGPLAVAAVAPSGVAAALGVDLEPATELGGDVAAVVLRADERGIDAHLAFTLKEAVYKAWSGLGGRLLEHDDVRLSLGPADAFVGEEVSGGTRFAGRYARAADHWLALVVVPARGTPSTR